MTPDRSLAAADPGGPTSESEFAPIYHRYGPYRAGLPPVTAYARELWRRRTFAVEMSRATMRGDLTTTFFGQAWLVINPLLMATVYYLLVTAIRGEHDPRFFLHLTLALFAFTLVSSSVTNGAGSLTKAGTLLINTAFPRLLIPLATVRTAVFRFLPTVPVYLGLHLAFGSGWHPRMVLALYFLAAMIVFGIGLAAVFAAVEVYFRDTSSFLPYVVRIWTYASPVLWQPEHIAHLAPAIQEVLRLNPMYAMLAGYTGLVQGTAYPSPALWLSSAAWALAAAAVGFLVFTSREREFAIRLD